MFLSGFCTAEKYMESPYIKSKTFLMRLLNSWCYGLNCVTVVTVCVCNTTYECHRRLFLMLNPFSKLLPFCNWSMFIHCMQRTSSRHAFLPLPWMCWCTLQLSAQCLTPYSDLSTLWTHKHGGCICKLIEVRINFRTCMSWTVWGYWSIVF